MKPWLIIFFPVLLGSMPATAIGSTPEDCTAFLASGEAKRIDSVRIYDRYVAGFRDANDLACLRKDDVPVDGNVECAFLKSADSYLRASEVEKLTVFERGCRTNLPKQLREIIIQEMLDRMKTDG